jgi:hypothetical protein
MARAGGGAYRPHLPSPGAPLHALQVPDHRGDAWSVRPLDHWRRSVQKQFFPASDRPELLATLTLNKNASIFGTQSVVNRVQKLLAGDPDIDHYSVYIGGGAIRFYLPLDVQLDNSFGCFDQAEAKAL